MGSFGHLYLMQNHLGLIKLGRSVNPETRRRSLEATENCEIRLVAIFENDGELEEEIHRALDRYRLVGEWFSGEANARRAIRRKLNLPRDTLWPFELSDPESANRWLDQLEDRRWLRSVDREYGRLIREMSEYAEPPSDPSRWWDVHIWSAIWRFEYQIDTIVSVENDNCDDPVLIGYRRGLEPTTVPAYTSDIVAAKQLWPAGVESDPFVATPWEFCIAGLRERKRALSMSLAQKNRLT